MAELPLDQAIPRFKANEDRMDRFMNGTALQTWFTSTGVEVPSIRKFLADKDSQINVAADGILAQATTQATNAANSASSASTSADAAADSALAADASADAAAASAAAVETSITNRMADQPTARRGADNTKLMSPLRTKEQVDVSVFMRGTFGKNDFGTMDLQGSGTRTIEYVAGVGYVLQSQGVSFVEMSELPRAKGRVYNIKARVRSTVETGAERVYVGFKMVSNTGVQTYTYVAANNVTLTVAAGWTEFEGQLDCDTLAADIVKIAPRVLLNYNVATGTQQLESIVVEGEDPTKLFGSASKARTRRARWGDTINMREFLDRSGSDASMADTDAGLIALIAHLNANPQIKKVYGLKGDVFRTSLVNRVWPLAVDLMMDGARFRWSGDLGGGNSQFMGFTGSSVVQGMGFDIVSGSTFRRLFTFENAMTLYNNEVVAESQINNAPTSGLLDWAVRVYRDNNKVRDMKIVNVDKAFFGYGADGDGNPGNDNHFEDIKAVSYVTGICMRNQMRTKLINPYVSSRSPNATDDPGNNGILHEGVREYLLANAQVFDAGEHGIRFGGTRNAEQLSVGIMINGAQIVRSGQSGLKFFTGVVGGSFVNVQGSNIQVIDCQYEPATPAEGPGFNDEGFLLQQIRKGTFNGLSVQRQSRSTYSCMDGVYISGADDLQINGLHVQDPKRNAVRISEYDGDTAPNSVETLANNEVFIRGLRGENIGEHGIFVDSPVQLIRDLNVEGELIGSGAAGFYAYSGTAAVARFQQPSLVQLKHRNFAAGATSLASSGNWKFRDVFGSVY